MSDCPRHRRASEIFGDVCDLPQEARTTAIAQSCHGDPQLAAEVLSLLAFDDGEQTLAELDDGAAVELPDVPLPERIGEFAIERLLGQGGMGRVYLARQQNPQRLVALKVLPPGWSSEEQLAMLQREAQMLGGLQHGFIAHVYAAGVAEVDQQQTPYFVMEYVDGRTLTEHVQGEALSLRSRVELLISICHGVSHAHQRGLIHRDLKPSNIMVEASGQPKILDFGVAVSTAADAPGVAGGQRTMAFGTPSYMSPEQFGDDRSRVDTRVDIYALGVLMYELLVGQRPFRAGPPVLLEDGSPPDAPSLGSFAPSLRGDLSAIAAKAIAYHRENRYATVSDLAEDLQRFLNHEPVHARQGGPGYRTGRFVRRHRLASALTALLVLGAVIGMSMVLSKQSQLNQRTAELEESLAKQEVLTTRAQGAEQVALQRLAESHVRAADLAAQRGAWPLARSELEQALALGVADEVDLLPRKVRASIALGDMARAGAELDLLASLGDGQEAPRDSLVSELLLLRGVVQLSDGRSRDLGQAAIRDALDGELSEADELYAMGLLGSDANRARQLFGAAIEADPFHHLAWQATLETLALSGHLLKTIATAETVLQLFPDDRTALLYRAGAALLMDDRVFAEACVQEAKESLGTPAISLLDVVRQFRELLELGIWPEDGSPPSLTEMLSRAMQSLQQIKQVVDTVASGTLKSGASETLFLDSIPQLTFVVESYSLLGQSMLAQSLGQYGEAQRLLSEAARINPCSLFHWIGGMYELSSAAPDFAVAETAYLRSLESDPFSPAFGRDAELQLLICQQQLMLQGDDEAVRSRLTHTVKVLMARDELPAALCRQVFRATLHIGRSDLGRGILERWKRLAPDDPEPLAKSSFAEYEAGAYWQAIDEATAALQLSPTETMAQQVLDAARQRLDERRSAEAVGTPP